MLLFFTCIAVATVPRPATRLVDPVGGELPTQDKVLVSLATIDGRLPCLEKLPEAMPHHQRQFSGIDRQLSAQIWRSASRAAQPARVHRFIDLTVERLTDSHDFLLRNDELANAHAKGMIGITSD